MDNLPCLSRVTDELDVFFNKSAELTVFKRDGDYKILSADGTVQFETADEQALAVGYATTWLETIACKIGMGFHPDTSADQYSPALPEPLNSEYDTMIGFVFEQLTDEANDPYAIAMAACEEGGVIETRTP